MTLITLVRHGQASAQAADYDRLSPLGEQQAGLLGEVWAGGSSRLSRPGRFWSGPRLRQRRTAEIAATRLPSWPALEVLEDFDEMRIGALLSPQGIAEACGEHPHLMPLIAAVQEAEVEQKPQAFVKLGSELLGLWRGQRLAIADGETWPAFLDRARRAAELLRAASLADDVVVVSSAGMIAALLRELLGGTDDEVLAEAFRIPNAAVTQVRLSASGGAILKRHDLSHLPEAMISLV